MRRNIGVRSYCYLDVSQFILILGVPAVFDKFLQEHYMEDTRNFLIESYNPGSSGALASSSTHVSDATFPLSATFLGIFDVRHVFLYDPICILTLAKLEGNIDSVDLNISSSLYVRVPFLGRFQLTTVSGNMKNGIKVNVDVLLAKGTFGLKLSGREVRALVDLNVKFVGHFKDDLKLLTLPYVSFVFISFKRFIYSLTHADSWCTNRFTPRPVRNELLRFFFSANALITYVTTCQASG
jgi:hypothetical protein